MIISVPQTVAIAIGSLYGVLAAASAIVALIVVRSRHKDLSELVLRTKSWWIIVTIFSAAIVLDRGAAIILLAFVSFLALKEFLSVIPTRRADRRVLFWAYLAIPVQYFWIYDYWYGMFIIFIPVWVFLFLPFRMLLIGATEGFLKAAGTLHWGMMLCVFAVSHTAYLLSLPKIDKADTGSVGLLLFLVFLTQFNDVAQYVWGKTLGRHKIVPKVSPGKTWEGFLGGVVSTALVGYFLAPWLTPFDEWQHRIAIGAMIAVAGFLGDITISALKRDVGVKDSSNFIPGHGGILDRIDSLTFSAPVFFHYVFYFYYGPGINS